MAILSDKDILSLLNKDIVIEPFSEDFLTPVGYDFTVGDFVYLLDRGLLSPQEGNFIIPAKSTVQIMTQEALWVSSRIAGTFHSKVSLVAKGLSHISTTLDPGWYGPLLITVTNNSSNDVSLGLGAPFVTLLFMRVETPTFTEHDKPAYRLDILLRNISKETIFKDLQLESADYFEYIASKISNDEVLGRFKEKVESANTPMSQRLFESVNNRRKEFVIQLLPNVIGVAFIVGLIFLPSYWNPLSPFLQEIGYDLEIFAVQISGIIGIVAIMVALNKK